MRQYDFVAIGGGSAGLTAAARAAAAGLKTALVDRAAIGGLCSLNGCNPKKVLVRSTELLEEIRRAAIFGLTTGPVEINWSKVIDRKESFASGVTASAEQSLKEQGIDLVTGDPKFLGKNSMTVNGTEIEIGSAVIATGSTPRSLDFPGAQLAKISDDILALRRPPETLVIIGAGVVAFEFAQVFARLGSKVVILARGNRALARHDEEMVQFLIEYSGGLGVTVLTESTVRSLIATGHRQLRVEYEHEGAGCVITADFVLNAAGRVPAIRDLCLEVSGIEWDDRGVTVSDFLRSTNASVFAAGDAHGRLQLSPIASYEGRVVARNLLEGDVERVDYSSIPQALYTVPPLASVGLTEAEARKRGLKIHVHRNDMSQWLTFAIIEGKTLARSKVILDPDGRVLGAHLLCPQAGDLIHIFALAMKFGIPASDLKSMVYAYPTLSSALPHMLG